MFFFTRNNVISWAVWVCIALAASVMIVWLKSSDRSLSPSKYKQLSTGTLATNDRRDSNPIANLPDTEFSNTSELIKCVGSRVCGDCHAEQSDRYSQTAHSRTFSEVVVDNEPPNGVFEHSVSARTYSAFRRDEQLWHRESLRANDLTDVVLAEYPVKYVVGSGQFARTYLVEDQGFLAESPISWYASLNSWELSPSYDRPKPSGFQRIVDERCLFCHVGADTSQERLRRDHHEHAIACERCHGPGEVHVKQWEHQQSVKGNPDFTIIHPTRLGREEQESICAQCHLESAAFVDVRGRQWTQFRPGYALRHFVAHYRIESSDDQMTVVGHVDQLRQSRCHQKSATLTCTTCHKPHDAPMTADQRLAWHRAQCLSCHTESSGGKECRLNGRERVSRSASDNCVQCHMPRSPTETPHVVTTHHRIGLHGSISSPNRVLAQAENLVPVEDLSHLSLVDRERSLGLANLVFAESEDAVRFRKIYLERARTLLERAQADGLSDGTLHAALAQLQFANGELRAASHSATLALKQTESLTPAVRMSTESCLAQVLFQRRDWQAATRILEKLVRQRRAADDWILLGACRKETGDLQGALTAVERAAQINPANTELTWVLVEFSRLVNDIGRYDHYRQRAHILDKPFTNRSNQ